MSAGEKISTADLLNGVVAIATHLNMSQRQVYHLHETGNLPTFKLGARVCARRSELEAHFARASAARRGSPPPVAEAGGGPAQPAALLYGHRAIAAHLGIPASDVTRLDAERRLPTYQDDGCTVASTAALDHLSNLKGGA